MGKSKREFIMEELMEPGFIEIGGREILLEETEKGGESLLNLRFLSGDSALQMWIRKGQACSSFRKTGQSPCTRGWTT